jgi:hypothetical protein
MLLNFADCYNRMQLEQESAATTHAIVQLRQVIYRSKYVQISVQMIEASHYWSFTWGQNIASTPRSEYCHSAWTRPRHQRHVLAKDRSRRDYNFYNPYIWMSPHQNPCSPRLLEVTRRITVPSPRAPEKQLASSLYLRIIGGQWVVLKDK